MPVLDSLEFSPSLFSFLPPRFLNLKRRKRMLRRKLWAFLEGTLGGEVYLVGGAVRDLLLGEEPQDLDFATPLPPPRRWCGGLRKRASPWT